jgi:hypothetical protein
MDDVLVPLFSISRLRVLEGRVKKEYLLDSCFHEQFKLEAGAQEA